MSVAAVEATAVGATLRVQLGREDKVDVQHAAPGERLVQMAAKRVMRQGKVAQRGQDGGGGGGNVEVGGVWPQPPDETPSRLVSMCGKQPARCAKKPGRRTLVGGPTFGKSAAERERVGAALYLPSTWSPARVGLGMNWRNDAV